MNIVFIVSRYYPYIGGVEYVVKSVAERLVRRGHEVKIIAGEPSINVPKEEEIKGVKVLRWPTLTPSDAYHIPRKRHKLDNILRNIVGEAEVVHFHSIHSILTIYCIKKVNDIEVKKVLTPYYHGSGHTLFRKLLWIFWRRYIKRLVNMHNGLVTHTVSKLEAKLIKKDYDVEPIVIENGVEESILATSWRPGDYVLYAGRIEKYKNIHRLANIIHELNKKFDENLKLIVIGAGSFRKSLEKIFKKKNINYKILPFQPFKKYIEYLSHARLFCLLSEKESYPQSVNEANAIGVPVVIAKPWGLNFTNRKRTLIIDLSKNDYNIAHQINDFLDSVEEEPKSHVSSWNNVVKAYIAKLYN